MATKEQMKKAILEVAGNPDSGVIRDNVDKFVDAIVAIDNEPKPEKKESTDKENRVTKPSEIR